jgi:hypothetical protein
MELNEPVIQQRDEQPYVGLSASVTMDGFGVLDGLFSDVFEWLGERGIVPAGASFVRYLVIDMENLLEIEAAVPVDSHVAVDEGMVSDTLPAGSYVTLAYTAKIGEEHIAANAYLQQWARDHGVEWKNSMRDGIEHWGARIEISMAEETDAGRDTVAAYLVRD